MLRLVRRGTFRGAVLVAMVVSLCAPAAAQATLSFAPHQTFAGGTNPISVAVADFNSDGRPDVAVVNNGDGTVSVLLGNGNGTFAPQQTFAVGRSPQSVAVGDFNRDGRPDLAVANQTDSTVSVLLGNGDGTFKPQQAFAVGRFPGSVAVGDFNGDGRPDLAVASQGDGTVSVLLGNGDGTFGSQQTFAVGGFSRSVAVGDFNGDGKLDLAVANEGGNTVSVLLGNGDGTFGPQQTFAVGNSPASVAVGDFNGDGRPDLAVANWQRQHGVGAAGQRRRHLLADAGIAVRGRHQPVLGGGGGLQRRRQARPRRRQLERQHRVGAARQRRRHLPVRAGVRGRQRPALGGSGGFQRRPQARPRGRGRDRQLGIGADQHEHRVLLGGDAGQRIDGGRGVGADRPVASHRPGGVGRSAGGAVQHDPGAVSVGGWQLQGSGGGFATIPQGTVIPAHGHLLLAGPGSLYSLSSYAASDGELFDTGWSLAQPAFGGVRLVAPGGAVIDRVGFAGAPAGFFAGTGLTVPPALPAAQFAWVRNVSAGAPVNTSDNAADFSYVAAGDNDTAHGSPVLGAPGPGNLVSPVVHNDILQSGLLDPGVSAGSSPNRIFTAGSPGTLIINRTITNCSGQPRAGACANALAGTTARTVTRLRLRVTGLTTLDSPGAGATQAVLKADSSSGETGLAGANTCSGSTAVMGLTLDSPSVSGLGGLGSSWTATAGLPAGGLAPGQCINVEFKFDVAQGGRFSFAYNAEDDLTARVADAGRR